MNQYEIDYKQGYDNANNEWLERIDKIRAEIESIERYGTVNGHDIWLRTPEEIKKEVLKIVDKYKTESEE